jgi:hypothetical protein
MSRTYCKILAIAMLIGGILGFATPHLLGFHLTPVHNAIHLVTGALAAWIGFGGSYPATRTFCRVFGVVYGLVAVLGFVAPALLGAILQHPGVTAHELMPDNVFHVAVALSALFAGFSPGPATAARAA